MLKCYFENGYFEIPLNSLPEEGHFGFGFCCDAVFNGQKREAYAMLNDRNAPEPSYIDICERTEDDECIVTDHLLLENIEFTYDGFDDGFVERYTYDDDERSWLEDLYCALDNEAFNVSHWKTVQDCGLSEEDSKKCEDIYTALAEDALDDGQAESIEDYGSVILSRYGDAIRDAAAEYEKDLMEMAFKEFKSKIQFKTKY